MNKEQLIKNVTKKSTLTKYQVRNCLEILLGEIIRGTLESGSINIKEFGKFYKHIRKPSISHCGFNKIKGTYLVKESTSIKFKLSKTIKNFINLQ